jgi:hypothetical protein
MSFYKHALAFFAFAFFITCLPIQVDAQKLKRDYSGSWELIIRPGIAGMFAEIGPGLNQLENEFNHQLGPALDVGLSRTLGGHWEAGLHIGGYQLKGNTPSPVFSANGNHGDFLNMADVPAKYTTMLFAAYGVARYYFREPGFSVAGNTGLRLDPFVEAGIGFNVFITDLRYEYVPEGYPSDMIFVKGKGAVPTPAAEPQFTFGGGTRIRLKNDWRLMVALNLDLIAYDCVDAVHNYSKDGERLEAWGAVSRLMVGISLPLKKKKTDYMIWSPK